MKYELAYFEAKRKAFQYELLNLLNEIKTLQPEINTFYDRHILPTWKWNKEIFKKYVP